MKLIFRKYQKIYLVTNNLEKKKTELKTTDL